MFCKKTSCHGSICVCFSQDVPTVGIAFIICGLKKVVPLLSHCFPYPGWRNTQIMKRFSTAMQHSLETPCSSFSAMDICKYCVHIQSLIIFTGIQPIKEKFFSNEHFSLNFSSHCIRWQKNKTKPFLEAASFKPTVTFIIMLIQN